MTDQEYYGIHFPHTYNTHNRKSAHSQGMACGVSGVPVQVGKLRSKELYCLVLWHPTSRWWNGGTMGQEK